jgi:hypothetical protein
VAIPAATPVDREQHASTTSGSTGNGDAIRAGMPAKTTVAAPRMKMPTPSVSMISESSELCSSGRRTTRLKKSARATTPAQATTTAPPRPSPNAWLAAPAVRAPSIVHSPTAKLIMREAL